MLDGGEKWTTYNFSIAVYNYSLTLLTRIRAVIDELPPDFAAGWVNNLRPKRGSIRLLRTKPAIRFRKQANHPAD